MGDAVDQHLGLPGTGAGQHEDGPVRGEDGLALLWIETVEVLRGVHEGWEGNEWDGLVARENVSIVQAVSPGYLDRRRPSSRDRAGASVHVIPPVLERLLQTCDDASRDAAWQAFVDEYSRLILHVSRSQTASYDAALDRYTHVLEQLRSNDLRRLRGYVADGRGKFTTWLVVVARRLGIDQDRRRYGRSRGAPEHDRERRELADLMGSDLPVDVLPAGGPAPGDELSARELSGALAVGLEKLEPADRLLLRLRFHDDVSVAEIARILSLPSVFHVYRRLNRIYAELRSTLQGLGIEDPAP
jgi:RNA polymerase sigma factor (sigma-70 family)